MNYFDIHLSQEAGWTFAEEIGTQSLVHFMDANKGTPAANRNFVDPLLRCDKLETRLNDIEKICVEFGKEITYADGTTDYLNHLKYTLEHREETEKKAPHTLFAEIEELVGRKTSTINEMYKNHRMLNDKKYLACEFYSLLKVLKPHLPSDIGTYQSAAEETDESVSLFRGVQFFYFCGVLKTEAVSKLQRLVFRISRGNAYLHTTDLTYENENEILNYNRGEKKSAFFLVFQLGASNLLKGMLKKALDSLGAVFYSLPKTLSGIDDKLEDLLETAVTNQEVISKSESYIDTELSYFYNCTEREAISVIEQYRIIVEKEKIITEVLNKMSLKNGILHGKLWVSQEKTNYLKNFIGDLKMKNSDINIELHYADFESRHYKPPTLIETNAISAPFQEIVDTYGVPRYMEVNPGLFTIVTFAYEFGVMFGDIGHGGLILLFGLALVYFYEQIYKSALRPVLAYRYMFVLLGGFACYCGFIYNDFFAMPWSLFGTCYQRENGTYTRKYEDCTVIAGFDPVWYKSAQEVSFINSFKMKVSIVIGVLHMSFGIFIKAINSVKFRNYIDLFCEFLPQILFFWATFGYMCVAIILKWLHNWPNSSKAPSIISIFINMGIATPGSTLFGDEEGLQQTYTQQHLFMLAGICSIWMLVPKPLLLALKIKLGKKKDGVSEEQIQNLKEQFLSDDEKQHSQTPLEEIDVNAEHEDHDHDISEIFVHQMIEVIEFILGSVSNTASYLRLWALSLAHGQLAKVFLNMTVVNPVKGGNAIVAVIGFPIFVVSTIGVIMLMDFMECFLHTLRLHWVEFQNKFYKGDGYKFVAFCFSDQIEEELARKKGLRLKE